MCGSVQIGLSRTWQRRSRIGWTMDRIRFGSRRTVFPLLMDNPFWELNWGFRSMEMCLPCFSTLRIQGERAYQMISGYISMFRLPTDLVSSENPNVIADVTTLVDKWSHLQASMLPIITVRASTGWQMQIYFWPDYLVFRTWAQDRSIPRYSVERRKRRAEAKVAHSLLEPFSNRCPFPDPVEQPLLLLSPQQLPWGKKRNEVNLLTMRNVNSSFSVLIPIVFPPADANAFCQRKGLYVDFDVLGWKQWVIAPEGISAFYCSGACSAPFHKSMNATSHAIVQSLIYLVRPNTTTAAQCAPSHLTSMKILFVDTKKNVQIKRYRDMVVEECGCHWERREISYTGR